MPIPCTPTDPMALKIIQACDAAYPANNTDCNQFVKAALTGFVDDGYFDGLNADAIVGKLKDPGEGWATATAIATAIMLAKAGNMVIAGMTSTELGDTNGHLAVVVGCDGQVSTSDDGSSSATVPIAYAGSLHAPWRIAGARLSGTFKGAMVRAEQINYYSKATPTS
jgi:hypothetical protein